MHLIFIGVPSRVLIELVGCILILLCLSKYIK